MAKTYNPYNDYRKIVGYKGNWHTAQQLGDDPSQYYQSAMPYYQSLMNNGYEDLANELSQSDYIQAKGLRDKYGLKEDAAFDLDQTYNEMTGNYSSIPQSRNDASIDRLLDITSGASGMANDVFGTAQGIANGTTPITPNAATQNMLDAYSRSDERLNGAIQYDRDGNVVSGLNTEHYNIGRNQLDYYNNFDVTKQPYYEGIMAQYQLGGQNAANQEYANGAANNGGNIDSYAAANANRQQLAFTTAGQQAALAAAQQNANNWNTVYAQMSSDLYNQGALSMKTLDAARQMYATDAQERMNALDNAGALASAQMQSAIAAFETLVQERMNDKNLTVQQAMQENDIAAAREQLEMELASNERIQEGLNNVAYYQTDANERINAVNADVQRHGYDTQLAGTRYSADANRDIAGINANANMYNADRNYWASLAGYQNALDLADVNNRHDLDRIAAQALYDSQNANTQAERERARDEWLISMGLLPSGASERSNNSAPLGTPQYDKDGITDTLKDIVGDNSTAAANVLKEIGATNINNAQDMLRFLKSGLGMTQSDAESVVKDLTKYGKDFDIDVWDMFSRMTNPSYTLPAQNTVRSAGNYQVS